MKVVFFVASALAFGACSTHFSPQTCTTDGDCGANVCSLVSGEAICVDPASAAITLGQSAPFTGANKELGLDMNAGIMLAVDEANGSGGIRGRQLKLNALDDGYEPAQAQANAMTLTDAINTGEMPTNCPNTGSAVSNGELGSAAANTPVSTTALDRGSDGVLALVGSVGTPTAVRATPVATETHTLFYGAFTGATTPLRDMTAGSCQKYVFNMRASYSQEAMATMNWFQAMGVPITGSGSAAYDHLISFDQNDTYGNAGYNGLVAAWEAFNGAGSAAPIARYRYTRNAITPDPGLVPDVESYLSALVGSDGSASVGILMTDTYSVGASFIQQIADWQVSADGPGDRLTLYFSDISFVGADALADALVQLNDANVTALLAQNRVIVSEVVPNYQDTMGVVPIVTEYKQLASAGGEAPSFAALEGYMATKIFVQGLLNAQGPITPDAMITSLETLPNLSLGLGASAGFSATNHQYLDSVWGTSIGSSGSFNDAYYWTTDPSNPLGSFNQLQ